MVPMDVGGGDRYRKSSNFFNGAFNVVYAQTAVYNKSALFAQQQIGVRLFPVLVFA